MDRDELVNDIDTFLEEHRDGDSSFAPVTHNDMSRLNDIVYKLARLKFEPDCDGDLPITWVLVNRHTHSVLPHYSVPIDQPVRALDTLSSIMQWSTEYMVRITKNLGDLYDTNNAR